MELVKNITKYIDFRLVELADADFILALRLDENKNINSFRQLRRILIVKESRELSTMKIKENNWNNVI